ncbi:MAG: thiamine-phosphate kinase [Cytophagales bacterium]|nr:thiamine-phosphate kinase [Cytophagales bacterium]
MKFTQISDIGEFGLINRIKSNTKIINKETICGIGDDAAILNYSSGMHTLISTDMMVENIHFDLAYTPLKHLGYKAVVANVSDICAMNGVSKHIAISLAISSKYTVEAIDELYEGIWAACSQYQVDLVGGNITSSLHGMVIAATVTGIVQTGRAAMRGGAKQHDLICVTGDLGGAYVGLQILKREKSVFISNPDMQPELDDKEYVLQRQLKPEARNDIVSALLSNNILPTSMIDISDGLASELFHLCTSSGTGCSIYDQKIPMDPLMVQAAEELNLSAMTCALHGGEDYELLFTVSQSDYEKVQNVSDISVIGYMTSAAEGLKLITKANESIPLQAQGWVHF